MKHHVQNAAKKWIPALLKMKESPAEDFGQFANAFTLLFATGESIMKAINGEIKNIDIAFGDAQVLENLREEITMLKDELTASREYVQTLQSKLNEEKTFSTKASDELATERNENKKLSARLKTLESVSNTGASLNSIETKIDLLLNLKQNGETKSETESTKTNESTPTTGAKTDESTAVIPAS
jgi:vacuolar-type H+-ATPase subunit I/STV1